MKGVILSIQTNNKLEILKKGDIVYVKDWLENGLFIIKDINNRYLKKDGEPDNPAMYILESKNGEEMNFEESELVKAILGFYDSDAYYNYNKYVKIGNIHPSDLINIKFKALLEKDLHSSQIDQISILDIVGLNFDGEVKKVNIIVNDKVRDYHEYFQLTTI